jgi:hypothetical protein
MGGHRFLVDMLAQVLKFNVYAQYQSQTQSTM